MSIWFLIILILGLVLFFANKNRFDLFAFLISFPYVSLSFASIHITLGNKCVRFIFAINFQFSKKFKLISDVRFVWLSLALDLLLRLILVCSCVFAFKISLKLFYVSANFRFNWQILYHYYDCYFLQFDMEFYHGNVEQIHVKNGIVMELWVLLLLLRQIDKHFKCVFFGWNFVIWLKMGRKGRSLPAVICFFFLVSK